MVQEINEPDINGGLTTVSYAVNEQDQFELVSGHSWQPVNVANHKAWLEIEKKVAAAKKEIAAGRKSCLHYYMTANQMDCGLLAGYTKQSRLMVRLHLSPLIFKRLSRPTLTKYAELFKVTIEDLQNGILREAVYRH